MAGWEKLACFRDGTILRNLFEGSTVKIVQVNTFWSLSHYTQSALFLSFWELAFLSIKWINRPSNNLQTLAYNVDSIEWKWYYRFQSILVTQNAFSLSKNQNNWKPQFSHPWSNWGNNLSKKITESATTISYHVFRQCFDELIPYKGAES